MIEKPSVDIIQLFLVLISLVMLSYVLYIFIRSKGTLLQLPNNKFLCSLLVSHILNQTSMLVIGTSPLYMHEKTPTSLEIIISQLIATTSLLHVALNTTLITLDRYLAIKLNLRYSTLLTTKRQKIMISLSWVLPLLLPFTGVPYHYYLYNNELFIGSLCLIVAAITVILTVIFNSVVNIYIHCKVRKHIRKIILISTLKDDVGTHRILKNKERKSLHLALAIIITYSISYLTLPAHNTLILMNITIPDVLRMISAYCITINALANAIFYVLIKDDIKNEFKKRMTICYKSNVSPMDEGQPTQTESRI